MPGVHFFHAGFVDLGALVDASLSGVVLVLLLKLGMQHLLPLCDYLGLLLLVLLEAHHQPLEGLLVRLLQHEVLDRRVR